jgi:chromosome segregation ATPase
VSTKKTPRLKQWLKTGSIAFIASCGCTLPFTQNLAQSALVGLATMPGVAASTIVRSRKRKQQVHRQLARGKQQLYHLQQSGALLDRQLQLKSKDRQAIESKVAQLHSLAASLADRLDLDLLQQQQLEQKLSSLTDYYEDRQAVAKKLDRHIQEKQASLLEIDTEIDNCRLKISQLQAEQIKIQNYNDSLDRRLYQQAKIDLKQIQAEIDRHLVIKQELELNIQQLQERQTVETGDEAADVEQKHLLLQELDTAISERSKFQQDITTEIERLGRIKGDLTPELTSQEQRLVEARSQLNDTDVELQIKRSELADLAAEILDRRNEIEMCDRSLKMSRLELSSKQAELDNLDLKVDAKRQSIDEPDPWLTKEFQTIVPQPPTIDRSIDSIVVAGAWHDKFIDNPHLSVLQHIEKHGTITEAEASSKLGNARSVRQFANKLEEYTPDLPFSIRVESSPKGNRYIKETQN